MRFTSRYCCGSLMFDVKRDSLARLEIIYVQQKKSWSALARPMQCGFPSEAVRSAVWCYSSRKCKKIVMEAKKSNAIHFLIVLWFIYTQCEVHSTFSSLKKYVWIKETMQFSYPSDTVQFFVRCSAVFSRMKYPRRFGFREKQSVRISVNSKFLLNCNELERVFYMKKLCLVDIFPTEYRLNHSDQWFVKISQKTAAATHRPPHDFQN